jgi:hypothetical protein
MYLFINYRKILKGTVIFQVKKESIANPLLGLHKGTYHSELQIHNSVEKLCCAGLPSLSLFLPGSSTID